MAAALATANSFEQRLQLISPPSAIENLKAGKPKQAKPIDFDDSTRGRYNRQLQAILTAINADIKNEVIPVIHRLKSEYVTDHFVLLPPGVFLDAWPTTISAILTALGERWTGQIFKAQAKRIAAGTVRRVEAENGEAFLKSVNKAVGVEVFGAHSEALNAELEAAELENAQLITKMGDDHIQRISNTVMSRMRGGYAPSVIAKDIREISGVSRKRAKLIARDQTAKLNSQITEKRFQAAGIEYFRWVDSGDVRVSGKPGGKYPNAKVKCWHIARADIGFGPGVYRRDKGASYAGEKGLFPGRAHIQCRCTASPVFEWEIKKAS